MKNAKRSKLEKNKKRKIMEIPSINETAPTADAWIKQPK
jgi:hypothetical protein